MQCEDMAARLTDLLEGDLDEEQEGLALAHLATCPHCEQVLAETNALLQAAPEAGREQLDASTRHRLLRVIVDRVSDQEAP